MFGMLFRGALFLSVVMAYTLSIWNIIDNYFREELKRYLHNTHESNKFSKPSSSKDLKILQTYQEKCYIESFFLETQNNNNDVCFTLEEIIE